MLEQLRRRTSQLGLDIVLINIWESVNARAEARQYCDVWGVEGDVLVDESADYARLLGVRGVPMNVAVDADGTVVEVGATTPDELHSLITRMLGTADW